MKGKKRVETRRGGAKGSEREKILRQGKTKMEE
jgi:hypothetical protein